VPDSKPTVHEVRVAVTRYMTFRVEDSADAYTAIGRAERLVWDDGSPDDEDLPSLEVKAVTVNGREIEFTDHIDWNGPTDARGLHGYIHQARIDGEKVAEARSFEDTVRLAEASVEGGGPDAA
jgi:hypothetical protein